MADERTCVIFPLLLIGGGYEVAPTQGSRPQLQCSGPWPSSLSGQTDLRHAQESRPGGRTFRAQLQKLLQIRRTQGTTPSFPAKGV